MTDNIRWMIHTKSGVTFTSQTHYPKDVPLEEITSVERIIGDRVVGIKKHKSLHHFFPKSTASKDFIMTGAPEGLGARPTVIEGQAVGCYLGQPPNMYRLELECDPRTGNVYLKVYQVEAALENGFDNTEEELRVKKKE
jgi:hypothetical protein